MSPSPTTVFEEGTRDAVLYLLRRAIVVFVLVILVTSIIFTFIYMGPKNPGSQKSYIDFEDRDRYEEFKLIDTPVWEQYAGYMKRMLTLSFGEVFNFRGRLPSQGPIENVNDLIVDRFYQTLWLWFWAFLIGFGFGIPLGILLGTRNPRTSSRTAGVRERTWKAALYGFPLFLFGSLMIEWLNVGGNFLFGFNWRTFAFNTPLIGNPNLNSLTDLANFLTAIKQTLPASLTLGLGIMSVVVRVGYSTAKDTSDSNHAENSDAMGILSSRKERIKRHLPNIALPLVLSIPLVVNIVIGGTLVIEEVFDREGIGALLVSANRSNDISTLQATLFVFVLITAGSVLLRDFLYTIIAGPPSSSQNSWRARASAVWTGSKDRIPGASSWSKVRTRETRKQDEEDELETLIPEGTAGVGLVERLRSNPRPALVWLLGILILLGLEFGAVLHVIFEASPWRVGAFNNFENFPTLLSRDLISNEGYRTAPGVWRETFLGLEPRYAWIIRTVLVYAYAVAWLFWIWLGYRIYSSEYRREDTTPTDRILRRLKSDSLAKIGLVIVFGFVVMAVFAPALSPTDLDKVGTARENGTVQFLSQSGEVERVPIVEANHNSRSWPPSVFLNMSGLTVPPSFYEVTNKIPYGIMSYDKYGRFHPAGTTPEGEDLFSDVILEGAQVYLFIGAATVVLSAILALILAFFGAYYRKWTGKIASSLSDWALIIPILPISLYIYDALGRGYLGSEPRISDMYNNSLMFGVLISVVLAGVLKKTIQGPVNEVVTSEWFESSRFQRREKLALLWRYATPQVFGYLLVYVLMGFAGVILTTAALSRVGGTVLWTRPEGWTTYADSIQLGGAKAGGRFATSMDWHVAILPGIALVVVVIGFVLLADAVRNAVDEEREMGDSALGEAFTRGGGG